MDAYLGGNISVSRGINVRDDGTKVWSINVRDASDRT